MIRTARTFGLAVGLFLLVALPAATPARAASAPSVTLDRTTVKIGDRVTVALHDWPAQRAVAISLCGNAAARGSIDCDLTSSLGYGITATNSGQAVLFRITTPPVPCPCVIQVTNTTQTETAYAPITIQGFPTGPVIGNKFESPLTVSLRVRVANDGPLAWLRSSLGGPTTYRLTVVVHNRSAQDATGVSLRARAGRSSSDQARVVKINAPDVVPAGQSWTRSQKVTLAAPVVGRFTWDVTASGDGPTAHAQASSRHTPLLLMLIILVVVGDVALIVGRRIERRRERSDERETDSDGLDVVVGARTGADIDPGDTQPVPGRGGGELAVAARDDLLSVGVAGTVGEGGRRVD